MLDERWSEEVEEIGQALRRLLSVESSPQRVRAAEAGEDGRDRRLEAELDAFGLNALEAEPDLFARIAFELGRSLATTPYVETIPVLALTQRPGVALGLDGPAPASAPFVAVRGADGVHVETPVAAPRRTAAGDFLVEPPPAGRGDRIGGNLDAADRLLRYGALVNAARLTGAGQGLLAYGVDYARERQQFGKPIGGYQAVAHRLANAAGALDAAELMVRKAAFTALARAGGDGAPSDVFALMVWVKAVEAARFTATTVHQVFGGAGFAMEYDVQLFSRRMRSWAMRGPRAGQQLAELGRRVLDPARRDQMRLLWQYDAGLPLPRWARESDALGRKA